MQRRYSDDPFFRRRRRFGFLLVPTFQFLLFHIAATKLTVRQKPVNAYPRTPTLLRCS
jgi:hypothetical protein